MDRDTAPAPSAESSTAAGVAHAGVATEAEARAVAERYARRPQDDRYHPLQPDVLCARQERQRALAALLRRHAPGPVSSLSLLEVGCGAGDQLLEMIGLGFDPARLAGIELLPERAAAARARLPAATAVHRGDALAIPLPPASVDLVLQATVFSSLLDDGFQQRLAAHMWSLLRPGGAVIWYDFTVDNPRNPDVRGVPMSRVRALFPHADMDARRLTLAPPLGRPAARVHPWLWQALNALPLLRTHRLIWIRKRA